MTVHIVTYINLWKAHENMIKVDYEHVQLLMRHVCGWVPPSCWRMTTVEPSVWQNVSPWVWRNLFYTLLSNNVTAPEALNSLIYWSLKGVEIPLKVEASRYLCWNHTRDPTAQGTNPKTPFGPLVARWPTELPLNPLCSLCLAPPGPNQSNDDMVDKVTYRNLGKIKIRITLNEQR